MSHHWRRRSTPCRVQQFGELAVMIPPYDNVDVLSGQGTCGLEMLEQVCFCASCLCRAASF